MGDIAGGGGTLKLRHRGGSRALQLSLFSLSSKSGLFSGLWPSELGHPEAEVLNHKLTQRHMHPEVSQLERTGQDRESFNHVSKSPEILLKMLNPGPFQPFYIHTLRYREVGDLTQIHAKS